MNPTPSKTVAHKSRVFIVDDHPLVREGLTNLINRQDDLIVCGEARNSAQAIDGIMKTQPDVAVSTFPSSTNQDWNWSGSWESSSRKLP